MGADRMTAEDGRRLIVSLLGKPLPQCEAGLREFVRGRLWAYPGELGEDLFLANDEQRVLGALLSCPSYVPDVTEELPPDAFDGAVEREVYVAILATFDGWDINRVDLGLRLTTPAARELVCKLEGHHDLIPYEALRYARSVAAAWGDR